MEAGDGRDIMGGLDGWQAVEFVGGDRWLERDPGEVLLLVWLCRGGAVAEVHWIERIHRIQEDHVGRNGRDVGITGIIGVHQVECLQSIGLEFGGTMKVRSHG